MLQRIQNVACIYITAMSYFFCMFGDHLFASPCNCSLYAFLIRNASMKLQPTLDANVRGCLNELIVSG
jgi:hypothetical protein